MPCPASTRLMRTSGSEQHTVSVGVSSVEILSFDVNRVAVVISSPTTGPMWMALRTAAAAQQGIVQPTSAVPFILTLGDHGALVQGPINAVIPTGPEAITVWSSSVILGRE